MSVKTVSDVAVVPSSVVASIVEFVMLMLTVLVIVIVIVTEVIVIVLASASLHCCE